MSLSKNVLIGSTPYRSIGMRSSPKPNANPEYSSGSIPTLRKTFGSTIPQPPSSIHPVLEQTRQPAPSQKTQVIENSADGSVNGKNDGSRREFSFFPKYALVNASSVPARSPNVMPRSTASPSIWWKTGEWRASSVSLRYVRPG